ncbi:TonB-dependent receptor [Novosphingobium pentaromativorans]|uniref:TonB-dependent receptor n=1 Tax=Novosphingobium pentaromativorans US6-1 TaxID=1088721 RepID=G6E895_9SPHN|nr:TonB-dependent receptor [Novosphingobium pentaromativorans]AIT81414.1 hypothetical protein JI59_17280 [Novosphingobium pentaromativorans US6-1]EHJ62435.1 hypothetical protein NSU_0566 [Novosphingobium pentaromativorans US6-1]
MVKLDWRTVNCLKMMMVATSALVSVPALAQTADEQGASRTTNFTGLNEIVVTAQKREQSLQDVPVAVTALTSEVLEVNRISNVADVSGLAPSTTIRTATGGTGLPTITIRGTPSTGLAPGSDKQAAIYLDGVYLSSPRGSIFELPDIARIEVLRGPQGTLFGRNATVGAISISTRDPDGVAGVTAGATFGNQDEYRFRVTANTPQMGPFSAYFSYLHQERRGDIRNLATPRVWDRSAALVGRMATKDKTAEWLGSKNVDSYFAAVKFETGDFKAVYKYDRSDSSGTPEGNALIGVNASSPLVGPFVAALVANGGPGGTPIPTSPDNGKRPDGVYNAFSIPTDQYNFGHSITASYQASDSLSFKAILGYREQYIFAASAIDGFSSVAFPSQALLPYAQFAGISLLASQGVDVTNPANGALVASTIGAIASATAPNIGQPFITVSSAAQNRSRQWSGEFQANYVSSLLTLTAGAVWFKGKDDVAQHYLQNTPSFRFYPDYVIPRDNIGAYFNEAKSIAAYAQGEFHVTPELDLVVGARITRDDKSGTFTFGANESSLQTAAFDYKDTQFNYLLGVNYNPSNDLLLYAKYSTGYVSGGAIASIPFKPEKVKAAEAGVKAEWLNRKVRTNLALWYSDQSDVQAAASANTVRPLFLLLAGANNPVVPFVSLFQLNTGDKEAYGAELELDIAPTRGLTLGGSASYTHVNVSNVPSALQAANNNNYDGRVFVPKWTASGYAQYDTEPLFGDAYLSFRTDAIYTDTTTTDNNPDAPMFAIVPDAYATDAYVRFNGRVALRNINFGKINGEIALWGRNIFDVQRFDYAVNVSNIVESATYIPARSYGVDLTMSF